MSGRSLQASQQGIERARQALVRRNLIQKSLVDEGIASWSTINRFFNGKPINRTIFLEICDRLDLIWSEIVRSPTVPEDPDPPPPDPAITPWWIAIQQASTVAREALTPRILQQIARSVVQDRYLPAIERGLQQGLPRIIALIGPAGYGKSTILGHLYDQLTKMGSGWTALLLCNSLYLDPNVSAEKLATSIAENLCGTAQPLFEITAALTSAYGRGMLLIDTLDLVISRAFVSAFSSVLRQLLEQEVTLIFTCRDYEYNDFLEPTREKLAGLAHRLDRHTVPGFNSAEVQLAAQTFFANLDPPMPDRGKHFAEQILNLSADNRSLREITQNPLLLALLCDLFAWDGNVPADLTVSKLYQRYWTEKITYSRTDGSHSSLLALEKDQVCLSLARSLFERSQEKLCESAYPDEFGLSFTASIAAAYRDLLSEGVLEVLPSRRVHFFHQTLLEYAIAYWLTRHSAEPERMQLLETLQFSDVAATQTHWLPVLRQMLTILESESEFAAVVQHLDLSNVGIFGTVALATASRDQPDALLTLLPTALALGEPYQERLRQAIDSTSHQLAEAGWGILVTFLEQADHAASINTAKMMSTLLSRWWHRLKFRLPEALDAIARRQPRRNPQTGKHRDDRPNIYGWLLQACWPALKLQAEPVVLAALRRYYPFLGEETSLKVLHLHAATEIGDSERVALLQVILQVPFPRNEALETVSVNLLSTLLPSLLGDQDTALWSNWQAVLYGSTYPNWVHGTTQAVGQLAAKDSAVATAIVQDVLGSQGERLRRNLIALDAAMRVEAQPSTESAQEVRPVLAQIVQIPITSLSPTCLTALVRFLRHIAVVCTAQEQNEMARWVQPIAATQPKLFIPLLDTLADQSLDARTELPALIAHLPPQEVAYQHHRLLRFQPIAQHPLLETLDQPSQVFLVKFYRQQAHTDTDATARLLHAAQFSSCKEVAVAAAQSLSDIATEVAQMLPLLESRFAGVRDNTLQAIAQLSNGGLSLNAVELQQICLCLQQENDQTVSRLLCELVAKWVQHYRQVPSAVPTLIGRLPGRLLQKGTLDGGAARVLILALKAIAQSEPDNLDIKQFSQQVRQLLGAINLVRVMRGEAETIDLLSALDRLNKQVLTEIVRVDCPILMQKGWERNVYAVIWAIRRTENEQAALLDEMLTSSWCTPGITNCILEAKGV